MLIQGGAQNSQLSWCITPITLAYGRYNSTYDGLSTYLQLNTKATVASQIRAHHHGGLVFEATKDSPQHWSFCVLDHRWIEAPINKRYTRKDPLNIVIGGIYMILPSRNLP